MSSELWAVLYSQQQGFCHIEPLADMMVHNRNALARGREPSYHLIGTADSDIAATRIAEEWKKSGYAHNLHSLATEG